MTTVSNGYRRGGSYTRNGKTHYRRGAKITARQSYDRWGLKGDLAGLGSFLTVCEMSFRWGWRGLAGLWRGGKRVHELASQPEPPWANIPGLYPAPSPARRNADSALTFRLSADGPNGWRAGDVQCKVHHARSVKGCVGCRQAGREQTRVTAERSHGGPL